MGRRIVGAPQECLQIDRAIKVTKETMGYRKSTAALWIAAASIAAAMPAAYAHTPAPTTAATPAPATAAAEEPAPSSGLMIGPIKLSAQVQAGFNINPMRPNDGRNF